MDLSTSSCLFTRVTRSSLYLRTLLSSFNTSHDSCRTPDSYLTRVDAQASAERTGIGEWFPQHGPSGEIAKWFSMEIKQEDWPWRFEEGSKPSLAVAFSITRTKHLRSCRTTSRGYGGWIGFGKR